MFIELILAFQAGEKVATVQEQGLNFWEQIFVSLTENVWIHWACLEDFDNVIFSAKIYVYCMSTVFGPEEAKYF